MVLREVVRGCQTMTTAADNDDVIVLLRFRISPLFLPVLVMAKGVLEKAVCRIFFHQVDSSESLRNLI